jgi:hypothetical protein
MGTDLPMPGLQAETLSVIETVLEALAIPHAATTGHDETRARILDERLRVTVTTLQGVIAQGGDLAWSLDFLREQLAEHPPTGYVTAQQATERLAAGATWTEAVRLDQDAEAGR